MIVRARKAPPFPRRVWRANRSRPFPPGRSFLEGAWDIRVNDERFCRCLGGWHSGVWRVVWTAGGIACAGRDVLPRAPRAWKTGAAEHFIPQS
jgi:hypothetical protein